MPFDPFLPVPHHVVVIPDGNRRWARERGLASWKGHEAGVESTEKILKKAKELAIPCLSLWGSSLDNLTKRPLEEKLALLRIYEVNFAKLAENEDIHEDKVRINFFGRWEEQLPGPVKKSIYRCREATKNYRQRQINFFLAYNGDDEMLQAVKGIAAQGLAPNQITFQTVKEHLMTKDLPPVDFLIRTGGEPHWSTGFMMWDVANAQLSFSETYYPDFDGDAFEEAIGEFQQRKRRHGE